MQILADGGSQLLKCQYLITPLLYEILTRLGRVRGSVIGIVRAGWPWSLIVGVDSARLAGMQPGRAGVRQSVVIVDADEVYRAGVADFCRRHPGLEVVACCSTDHTVTCRGPAAREARAMTALVEASACTLERDRFCGVAAVSSLRAEWSPDELTIIATCRTPASRYLTLRLTEAGADFYYGPLHRFASGAELTQAVCEPSEGCRLPTQWALREELGLSWDGNLAAFLAAVDDYSDELWLDGRRQSDLPVSRRTIARLRQLAHEVAGLPAPDFRRFTGTREPPSLPEWHEVRWLVRTLRGL